MKKIEINRHLFYETSHSPSLIDIVGPDMIDKVIDFCFIANPYYPDKILLKKMQRQMPTVIKSYPSSNPRISQRNIADVLNTMPENILIGNGATELITIIEKDIIDDIAIPVPTFSEYLEKLRQSESAKLYQLPPDNNYSLNLEDFGSWIDERKITSALIINPGNPTGELKSLDEMKTFLQKMSHLKMIIVDESFIDFADEQVPTLIPYISEYKNLMIIRSMSKHCGVPGLRLGYCCTSNHDFLSNMKKFLPVWNINTMAEYFLKQLKDSDESYREARLKVIEDTRYLYSELSKIDGFFVYPTGSNFLMIKCKCGLNATELQEILLEDHFAYVRDCSNKVGLDKYHIRVASQGKRKDKILIKALKDISLNTKKNYN